VGLVWDIYEGFDVLNDLINIQRNECQEESIMYDVLNDLINI
jgi:hypothetical protein